MKYNSLNVFDARPYSVQKLKFGASTLTTGKILSYDVSMLLIDTTVININMDQTDFTAVMESK